MACKIVAIFLCFCLCATGAAVAQSSMSSTSSGAWNPATMISNFPDCSTGGFTCWHAASVELSSMSNGTGAGLTGGLNSSGQIVTYTNYFAQNNPNTWTTQTAWGSNYTSLAIGSPTNIWAVGPSLTCGHGTTNIHIYNGNTWGENMGCKHVAHVAADAAGDGGGVESGGAWLYTKSSNTWQLADTTKKWIWEFIKNATTVYLVQDNHTVWNWSVGNGYTQLPNMSIATEVSVTRNGEVYVLGTDGKVHHYEQTTGLWDTLNGSGNTSLSATGVSHIFTTGPTNAGYNTYRFSENGIQWSRTFSGSVSCAQGVPPALCATFHHTSCVQLQSQGNNGPMSCATPWNGNGQWGVTATVNTHDVFACMEDLNNCVIPEVDGNMECSGGGSAFDIPTNLTLQWSLDHAVSDGTVSLPPSVQTIDRLWIAVGKCGATHVDPLVGNTCYGGDKAVCSIVSADVHSDEQYTPQAAQLEALDLCEASSPWGALALYVVQLPLPCRLVAWLDNDGVPGLCY